MKTNIFNAFLFFSASIISITALAEKPNYGPPEMPMPKIADGMYWKQDDPNSAMAKYWNEVAKAYGYKDAADAAADCEKGIRKLSKQERAHTSVMTCSMDPVALRRDESPEIKQYGFKNWYDARNACLTQKVSAIKGNQSNICFADPFTFIRK
jgi:hypothetical protein